MKLASFDVANPAGPERRLGAVVADGLIDLTSAVAAAAAAAGHPRPHHHARAVVPPDMLEFLEGGDHAQDAAREAIEHVTAEGVEAAPDGSTVRYDRDAVRMLSPLPRPSTIRDFITFEDHIGHFRDEIPPEWYELPVYYKGNPTSVVHPGDVVPWPSYTEEFDYELELAAVVGRAGRDIDAADAYEHITGYTIFNDFSARDIQRKERVVGLGPGKAKDFANGFGPVLVTADDFDPSDAEMRASVNGEQWSAGNSGDMHHTFADLVAHASMDETIHVGDVLGSGTVPTGCGPEVGKWVQPGDTIALEIEGIGVLEHQVGEPPA